MSYFIGITLPKNISDELVRVQQAVAGCYQGNEVAPDKLHVTLLFLGTLAKQELTQVQDILRTITVTPFTLTLGSLETKKHLIWATVPAEELTQLYHMMTTKLPEYTQQRPHTGHITLARVKEYEERLAITDQEIAPLSWQVDSFGLYSSQTLQEGPQYNLIETYS